jgi:hypothetical protein
MGWNILNKKQDIKRQIIDMFLVENIDFPLKLQIILSTFTMNCIIIFQLRRIWMHKDCHVEKYGIPSWLYMAVFSTII